MPPGTPEEAVGGRREASGPGLGGQVDRSTPVAGAPATYARIPRQGWRAARTFAGGGSGSGRCDDRPHVDHQADRPSTAGRCGGSMSRPGATSRGNSMFVAGGPDQRPRDHHRLDRRGSRSSKSPPTTRKRSSASVSIRPRVSRVSTAVGWRRGWGWSASRPLRFGKFVGDVPAFMALDCRGSKSIRWSSPGR